MVRKILRALTSYWEKKTTAIEEANDLSTLTVENLIGNLMAYEVQLEDRKKDNEDKNKKVLAFQASTDDEDSDDEEKFEIITRKFRKFLKKDSDSSVSEMEGSISSGEVWSTLSEDWEISSEEADPEEMFGERVDYSPIGHHTRGRLAKRDEEDDPIEEDSEEEDPIEEDPEEEDPIEEDSEEKDPIEEDAKEEDPIEEDPEEDDPEEDPEDPMGDEESME
ncbi:glutamic acid-rich protein-like [Asparagus officinalis]|uniref:glutamic acid-rich protein-like n=1 Tax=Asparagus officinalis TaxID=4686 RepID=UPI00098DE652|nr:glutamic acid-rich protein-like [Asparagus officinalis]